jgi:hypothetical protein
MNTVVSDIITVHTRVEIEMADGSNPPHKLMDLCQEFMWLMATALVGTVVPLFDITIPFFIWATEWWCSRYLLQ